MNFGLIAFVILNVKVFICMITDFIRSEIFLMHCLLFDSFKRMFYKQNLPSNFAVSAMSSLEELLSSGTDDVLRRELSLVADEDAAMKEVVAVVVEVKTGKL